MSDFPRLEPEALLSAVVNSSDDAIVSKDLNGTIMSWNPAAERMFGWTAEEAIGKSIRLIIPSDRQSEEDYVLSKVRGGEIVDHFETVRQRKDGSLLDISLTVSPIKDASGKIIGASKIARDITVKKRLIEAEHERLVRERMFQTEANRMKDQFLATLSHELRTPLNAIIGWSEMLLAGQLNPQETELGLKTIDRNARVQVQLVEDLLDVSRITSGKMRMQVVDVNLVDVARAAMDVMRPAAAAKKIKLTGEWERSEILIQGDPDRLQQVVWNLLSNAIKFTPSRGQVAVKVKTDAEGNACLIVQDTGAGIPEPFIPHVFDRFRQADGSLTRSHGGLGLGLSIVRQIVELHGGIVTVESRGEGQGTTFTAIFPGLEARRQRGPIAKESIVGGERLDGVRILIADDEADERELLTVILKRQGAVVRTVTSAAEALSIITEWRPNVLISDIAMPGEDGYSLVQRVRALSDPMVSHVPAVAVTAHARMEDRERAIGAGFDYHIGKPFDRLKLLDTIGAAAELGGGLRRVTRQSPVGGTAL